MDRMAFTAALALILSSGWPLIAQRRVSSERDKLAPQIGEKPTSVLRIDTLKGTLQKIDLQKRTVTVSHNGGEETFTFPTAAGREKVTLSKKAARALGKKSLRLEEVVAGCQVKVSYYPALGSIMELLIEELPR